MKKNILLLTMVILSGCSWLTPPLETPVIEEKLNKAWFSEAKVGTLSLTPDRRVVLVNFNNNRFCAEAPTEVGTDMSRLLKVAAEASKTEELKAGLSAINAAASSNSVLNKRTQGIQLFFANSYFLCQMYMNEAIGRDDLINLQLQTLNSIAPMIEKEISFMYAGKPAGNGTQKYVPLDINKILKDIENKPESKPIDKPEDE